MSAAEGNVEVLLAVWHNVPLQAKKKMLYILSRDKVEAQHRIRQADRIYDWEVTGAKKPIDC